MSPVPIGQDANVDPETLVIVPEFMSMIVLGAIDQWFAWASAPAWVMRQVSAIKIVRFIYVGLLWPKHNSCFVWQLSHPAKCCFHPAEGYYDSANSQRVYLRMIL
jgi:hypothetical protein